MQIQIILLVKLTLSFKGRAPERELATVGVRMVEDYLSLKERGRT